MGGYGEYAIVWICNCNWQKDQPVNCWELNEAIRLLEDKCGPGQGGMVRLHGGREIGRTFFTHTFLLYPFLFPFLVRQPRTPSLS